MFIMTYVHPSISSTITDNSVTYLTSEGTTKLFAVFASEKGVDNKIQSVTSASEFEFLYGEPNMKYYGQTAYNVIQWLNAGGGVFALRVLPDDAKYSHAIFNVQTKVVSGGKAVLDVDGNIVNIDDVTLRPTVSYTDINNTSLSNLKDLELYNEHADSLDGYSNHMLFAVVPRGRGSAYDDLGFKISLNDSFDSTYDFRLYNFEVQKKNSTGVMETIEGPFIVSFDPDAMSLSGESMFIESVVNKYNSYIDILFNTDEYETIAKIINPNVHPNKIDFLTGETRIINDELETYYDEVTGKEEDIHISLMKYDDFGIATGGLNIVDPTDSIESAIVSADNSYRTDIYNNSLAILNSMKEAYSKVKKNKTTYENTVVELLEKTTGVAETDEKSFIATGEIVVTEILNNEAQASGVPEALTSENLPEFKAALDSTNVKISKYTDLARKAYGYANILGTSADSVLIKTYIESIDKGLANVDRVTLSLASELSVIDDLKTTLTTAITDGSNAALANAFGVTVNEVTDMYKLLANLEKSDLGIVTSEMINEKIQTPLNVVRECYEDLNDKYTLEEDIPTIRDNGINAVNAIIAEATTLITYVMCEVSLANQLSTKSTIELLNTSGEVYLLATKDEVMAASDDKELIKTIKSALDEAEAESQKYLNYTYDTVLHNYNIAVSLKNGSDGSLDIANSNRQAVLNSLLIKGYTGLIDETLIDKAKFPIDLVLDANYDISVKNAIVDLCTEIRGDFMGILDTGFVATPADALNYRKGKLQVSNFRVAIFTQNLVVKDGAYTGQNIKVTTPYFLASKIPSNDNSYGIHYNFVGPRRGILDGFEELSFNPNTEWKERLYKAQVNYIEQNTTTTKLGCQLTSQSIVSALSNINNVRTLLKIQRDVEEIMADYQFEYNDSITRSAAQQALSGYLSKWTSNRACTSISGTVYASDYDMTQHILRVKIEMVFNSILERIAIDLIVNN